MSVICYHGETPYRINQKRGNEILEVMLDNVNRIIITCIKDEPKTALQVSIETGLSSSMTYRRLRRLKEKNLLILSGEISTDKKKRFRHKSKIRKVVTSYDGNVTDIKIYSNLDN
jgi:hypothetical protein